MAKQSNPAVVAGLVLAASAAITVNPTLTVLAGATLAVIWWGALVEPLRAAVACMLTSQWVQASAKLWSANAFGVPLAEPSSTWIGASNPLVIVENTDAATALSLAALACFSIGARVVLPRLRLAAADFARYAPERLLGLYIPLALVSEVAGPFFGGPLAQLLSALGLLRFAPVVLLVGVWLHTKRGGFVLAAIIGAEVVLGFFSFFSQWRAIIILVGVALVSLAGYHWRRHLPLLAGGLVGFLALATVWTVIKPDYREALNRGTRQQVVLLSPEEQRAALAQEISEIGLSDLPRGFLDLLDRAAYVDYFADVLGYVPNRISHQGGALWGEALGQFLMPRFLFPDKPPLPSDSERTMQFTGRQMASGAEGTSISIGYVGESYIDFGYIGALAIPFAIGMTYALAILALLTLNKSSPAVVLALSIPLIWPAQQFEMSNMKMVGGVAWTWVGCLLLIVLWPRIDRLLLRRTAPLSGRPAVSGGSPP